jgi:hypothetical protein
LPDPATLQATPGNAFSFLVQTQAADAVTIDCPAASANISPLASTHGIFTVFLGVMPPQAVQCSLVATGPAGSTTASLDITPQKSAPITPVTLTGLPDLVKVETGTTTILDSITMTGHDPATMPTVSCNKNKAEFSKLTPEGHYALTITESQEPEIADICTITVRGVGHTVTRMLAVVSAYKLPSVRPLNFATDGLWMSSTGSLGQQWFYGYADPTFVTPPQFIIDKAEGVELSHVALSCSGAGFKESNSQPFLLLSGKRWQMNIQYDLTAAAGATMEGCTLTLELKDPDYFVRPTAEYKFHLNW